MKNALREAMIGPSLIMVALSAMATNCHAQNTTESPAYTGTTPAAQVGVTQDETGKEADNALQVSASSDKTQYAADETIQLTVTVKNTSDKPIEAFFNSGQNFDFAATRVGEDTPTWRWSAGRMFTMIVRHQVLAAGQSLTFKGVWENAKPGHYNIEGKVTANGGLKAAPFEIEVD